MRKQFWSAAIAMVVLTSLWPSGMEMMALGRKRVAGQCPMRSVSQLQPFRDQRVGGSSSAIP